MFGFVQAGRELRRSGKKVLTKISMCAIMRAYTLKEGWCLVKNLKNGGQKVSHKWLELVKVA